MKSDFSYPEFVARFYDTIYHQIRTGTDNEFYLKKISEAKGKALEIGVGTGRLFMDALNNGADIYGIDISPSMIDVLKKKISPDLHHRIKVDDACTFSFPFKFDLIMAPFRVWSHITKVEDQLIALNNVYENLSDDGIFIFDLYVPDPKMIQEGLHEITDFEGEYELGKKIKRIVSAYPDLVNQITDVHFTFVWDEDDGEKSASWNFPMRFYFRYEIEHLIARSKLQLVNIFGDFDEHQLKSGDKEFIIVCKK